MRPGSKTHRESRRWLTDFDVAISTTSAMRSVRKVARVLGRAV